MSIQKDMEGLCNEAINAMDLVREKLLDLCELHPDLNNLITSNASVFVKANEVLNDILSAIEDFDA